MMNARIVAVLAVLASLFGGPVRAQEPIAPSRGAKEGTTVEVFLSFADPISARASVVLDALLERRPDSVRLVFRHVAPEDKPAAILVHRAAVAAAAQSRFWEMAQLLFANQDRHAREDLIAMARQLRLDVRMFAVDLDAAGADEVFAADRARAKAVGVTEAPSYVVSGSTMRGIRTLDELEAILAPAKQ